MNNRRDEIKLLAKHLLEEALKIIDKKDEDWGGIEQAAGAFWNGAYPDHKFSWHVCARFCDGMAEMKLARLLNVLRNGASNYDGLKDCAIDFLNYSAFAVVARILDYQQGTDVLEKLRRVGDI